MKNLYKKLLNLQKEVGAIKRDETNPYFKSLYFDINGLLAEIKPILNKHGLIVLQPLTNLDGKPALETLIIDEESGDQIKSVVILPENSDPQKMGSAITYFRRYSLQSFLLLQADDDDGNASTTPQNAPRSDFTQKRHQDSTPASNNSPHHICSKCGSAPRTSKTTGKMYCPNAYQGDKRIAGHTIIERDEKIIQLDEKDKEQEDAFLANMGI